MVRRHRRRSDRRLTSTDETALTFLDNLYRDVDGGWLTLFAVDRRNGDNHVEWFENTPDGHDDMVATALDLAAHCCVWFGVATRADRLVRKRRGGVEDCKTLPGLFVDID